MVSYKELANAIRILSIDAIQKAKSGHPGAPMGMADIAVVLWCDFLKHNPTNPIWEDRDRFVLSNGHASILLYSLLHLTGYDLSMNDLKNFRQLHSKTPGHPEYNHTPGVEVTTGPLGQGIANAVGFAIAERILSAQFNRPGYEIVNHNTYVFMGDGCLMEGISHEACSIAGTLQLGKLIACYDNNGISIDGDIKGWFTDNTAKRFESYGWHVIENIDGHNSHSIREAIKEAKSVTNKPSLLIFNTIIGFGSPNKAGTNKSHGAVLGEDEIKLTREKLEWYYEPFDIPCSIYDQFNAKEIGKVKENAWKIKFHEYEKNHSKLAMEFKRRMCNQLPSDWRVLSQTFIEELQNSPAIISTRKASQNTIEAFGKILPEYIGGSADLTSSNLTMWSGAKPINENVAGNYIYYGVREFGMTAIANGLSLHGGFLPYTGTFLIFSDYARNAARMAALMKIRHIMIYTHDSIGLGEDGPTHQPIEQLVSLRSIPNMNLWRPCDQVESAVAWKYAIERSDGPSSLIFSRQELPQYHRTHEQLTNISRGGYILKDSSAKPQLILIATGSEVALAMKAYNKLIEEDIKVRLVSMPSTDVFDKQDNTYRNSVLLPSVKARLAIEAGIEEYWIKYTGFEGAVVGMNTFGASAPAENLFNEFGLTESNIVIKAKEILNLFFSY